MALDPILWALKDAPVRSATERLVLTIYAEHADEDGCSAFPSYGTVGERALCDRKTVERTVKRLAERGLLRRGDPVAAQAIPTRYRPVVWDVMVPYAWWGDQRVERINRYRQQRGRGPITPESHPIPDPCPPRQRRSDLGVPRPRRRQGGPESAGPDTAAGMSHEGPQGGLTVPAVDNRQGGLSVPSRGDSQSLQGGTESPPNPPSNPPQEPPPTGPQGSVRTSGTVVGKRGGRGGDPDPTPKKTSAPASKVVPLVDEHHQAAAALAGEVPRLSGSARGRVARRVAECLAAGHDAATIRAELAGDLAGAGDPVAVLMARLRDLAASPVTASTSEQDTAAERDRMARTPHPHQPGRSAGYCTCGRHESNRVHRVQAAA